MYSQGNIRGEERTALQYHTVLHCVQRLRPVAGEGETQDEQKCPKFLVERTETGGLVLSMVPPVRGDERETWQENALFTSLEAFLSIYTTSPFRTGSNLDRGR